MQEELDSRIAAARWRFLAAYQENKVEELRLEINRTHQCQAVRTALKDNMRAVKDGAFSPRVVQALECGSLNELGEMLLSIRKVRDARKARLRNRKPWLR
jgi:hypothetical protein